MLFDLGVAVIVASGYLGPIESSRLLKAGATVLLKKPVAVVEMSNAIHRALGDGVEQQVARGSAEQE